jgi:hypothetical protein
MCSVCSKIKIKNRTGFSLINQGLNPIVSQCSSFGERGGEILHDFLKASNLLQVHHITHFIAKVLSPS